MYITLIKDAESIQRTPMRPREITNTGVAKKLIDSTKLLHFCGKRPLFIAKDSVNSDFEIVIPDNILPIPNLIITGQRKVSYETGKIVNEMIKDLAGEDVFIRAGVASLNPNKVIRNINNVQHLVVVGPESTLQKWTNCLCKDENSRTENSDLCILKDGIPVYDAEKDQRLYAFDGLMDHLLCYKINQQVYDNPNQAEKLQPFFHKVHEIMVPGQLLYRINNSKKTK